MHPKVLTHLEHIQDQTKLVLRAAAKRFQHAAQFQSDEMFPVLFKPLVQVRPTANLLYLSDLQILLLSLFLSDRYFLTVNA